MGPRDAENSHQPRQEPLSPQQLSVNGHPSRPFWSFILLGMSKTRVRPAHPLAFNGFAGARSGWCAGWFTWLWRLLRFSPGLFLAMRNLLLLVPRLKFTCSRAPKYFSRSSSELQDGCINMELSKACSAYLGMLGISRFAGCCFPVERHD